jgi:hypothetical protein
MLGHRTGAVMQADDVKERQATIFEHPYPGIAFSVRWVRADLARFVEGYPVADDVVLLASELATNAILHSRSGHPDRTFTVRMTLYPGDYAWVEVVDQGGVWSEDVYDDEHGRGLGIVAAVAGDGNWGIDGDERCRTVWFRLDWPGDAASIDRHQPGRPASP